MSEPVMHETKVRIGREAGRGAERIALVVSVLVLIAILKPWGSPPAAEPTAPRQEQPSVAPSEPVGAVEHACNNRHWLIQVDMLWPRRLVRSWILTDAVTASGPTDPRIRFVTVASPEVRALGFCPARGADVPPDTRPTFFRLGPPVEVVSTERVIVSRSPDEAENVLYRPATASRLPSASGARPHPTSWAEGQYVLRIDGPSGIEHWLGVEIVAIEDEAPR